MERSEIALLIPAHNESASIRAVVEKAKAFGTVIVCDDGSSDKTSEIAQAAGAKVVRLSENRGYEGALQRAFEEAASGPFKIAVTLDADGQHEPGIISNFVKAIQDGADVAVGKRTKTQRPAESVFSFFTRVRYGISDPLCGMKAYRMNLFRDYGCFDSYRSVGTELFLFAAQKGYSIKEIDIPVKERRDEPRFGSGLRPNLKILRALVLSAGKFF